MIFVFKTNISGIGEVNYLQPLLDQILQHAKWNFDLEDCDRILRIDSPFHISKKAIKVLQDQGYECEELND